MGGLGSTAGSRLGRFSLTQKLMVDLLQIVRCTVNLRSGPAVRE
jgi:hypothetical protein